MEWTMGQKFDLGTATTLNVIDELCGQLQRAHFTARGIAMGDPQPLPEQLHRIRMLATHLRHMVALAEEASV
jgi:hypothetical protein